MSLQENLVVSARFWRPESRGIRVTTHLSMVQRVVPWSSLSWECGDVVGPLEASVSLLQEQERVPAAGPPFSWPPLSTSVRHLCVSGPSLALG